MDHNGERVAPAARGQPGGMAPPGEVLHPHEPRAIGPYRLLRRLGAGGMGTVYLAESAGRRVAVKVVRPDLAADEEFRRRFRQEVDAARRVAPFCTAEVLDADPDAAAPYLVTEFIEGVRLDHAVENGPISGSTLTGLAVGVATALTAIHGSGLVHRDLKPSNVLLSMSGPRVIDFGIAQALEGAKAKPTAWGFGSAGWMAPEQVNGQAIGPEADVFTWGILVAYAGTGHHPFGTGTDLELSTRIVGSRPALDGLPHDLKALVAAALAKNPDDRPNARDLLLSLISLPPTRSGDGWDDGTGRPSASAVGQAEELLNLTRGTTLPGLAPTRIAPQTSAGERASAGRRAGPSGVAVPAPAGAPAFSGAPGAARDPATGGGPAGFGPSGFRPAGAGPAPHPPAQGPHPPVPAGPRGPAGDGASGTGQPRSTWHRVLLFGAAALTVVLAAWLISSVAGGSDDPGAPSVAGGREAPSQQPTAPRSGGLSTAVRDDQLEFVANKISCGEDRLGDGFLARRPSGQFCLVDMKITNVGTVERVLSSSNQYLHTSDGGRHTVDFLARYLINDGIWDTIPPGATVTGTFVFDIPVDAEAEKLELHERPESQGVTIQP
ncbi:serine/threonine protein kinase [Parafrankia soli]|uniref:Serine/threonine protein kinase n=1 Tax=Parafrankia soli TaxID=2599596 RepID=A0A1S1Q3E5_9ACTN|nr:protein kinase [Parafrankia soli]OHV28087.1 serine/threonine protein kinase [Parafrankia soli]